MTARRSLIVLMAFEGVAALCATVAFALGAPAAGDLLGGVLGAQATAAALLLAGLAAVSAAASFATTGALLRDRPAAEVSAAGVQVTYLLAGAIGSATAGLLAELVVVAALGAIGLVLALLSLRSARR